AHARSRGRAAARARAAHPRRRPRDVVAGLRQPGRAPAGPSLALPAHHPPLLLHAGHHDGAPRPDGVRAAGLSAALPDPRAGLRGHARGAVPRTAGLSASSDAARAPPGSPASRLLGRPDHGRGEEDARVSGGAGRRGPVVVLGGGAAGLAAGYYLARGGFSV